MPYDTIVDPAEAKESLEIVNLKGKIIISTGERNSINKHEHPFLC